MAVSVRMDPLMEKELELAARRQGVTKSQFIIAAVERALGRKDPAVLYRRVMEESTQHEVCENVPDDALSPYTAAVRQSLRVEYARQQEEFAAFLAERETQANADGAAEQRKAA